MGSTGVQGTMLHCFHHAGGDRRAFRHWARLGPQVRVVAYDDDASGPEPIVATARRWWRGVPDPSGVYYGHSMGALVAYEAAAAAESLGGVGPRAVVLGAPPGRHARRCLDRVGGRPTDRLTRDLARVRRYVPSRAALRVPVHVVRGTLDDVVGEADALEWTARGGPGSRHHRLPGAGHLFHHVPDDVLTDLVRAVAATPTGPDPVGPDASDGPDALAGLDALDADRGSAGAVA
ncbi:thioesterase domain-containing protein [Cellulosimicrobium composti]|uniref:thioesterase domain-containing protein n=1 Tax=Cellulosimicrobium composti TaxID=2672572 RepID=UPI0037A9DAA0